MASSAAEFSTAVQYHVFQNSFRARWLFQSPSVVFLNSGLVVTMRGLDKRGPSGSSSLPSQTAPSRSLLGDRVGFGEPVAKDRDKVDKILLLLSSELKIADLPVRLGRSFRLGGRYSGDSPLFREMAFSSLVQMTPLKLM